MSTTPTPAQNPSPMAPVGQPAAAHLGPPKGIPSGPSAADLQNQVNELQSLVQKLMAVNAPPEPEARRVKTYYHQTPGSTVVINRKGKRGENIPEVFTFVEGRLETADPDAQDFLDDIVDGSGVPIYSVSPRGQQDEAVVKAAKEVVVIASRTIDKLGAEAGVGQG